MIVSNSRSESEASSLATKSLRVFLVEDSPAIRDRLAEAISTVSRVQVVGHAETEADAIGALEAEPCDVVVLDLQLKEGHGFNVLKALRDHRDMKRAVFAVFSNHFTPQYLARGTELGAEYFFDKAKGYGDLCNMLAGLQRHQRQ